MKFSLEELNAVFHYNPSSGFVYRKTLRGGRPPGRVGTTDGKGYLHVSYRKTFIRLHRLGWFLTHGELPSELDHVNGNRQDNRLANLRPATRSQQSGNSGVHRHNRSGYRGVSQNSRSGKWHAQIKIGGKQTYLGRFDSPKEAALCYNHAAEKHFGPFAALNRV